MAKVTVLTAVYNAERYLPQCLDSLKGQTLSDAQFICIDDCSTDHSYEILKKYASVDSRFQLLRTPVNSGQAIARNLGLQFAQGEYVAMLDADDWFAPDTLELAYRALKEKKAPCAVLRLIQHYEEDGHEEPYVIRSAASEWSGEEAFRLSLDWSLHGLYVVETSLHKRFPFDTTCRLYSDDNTTRLHYLHSSRVVLCEGKYYYRKHAASMTNACTIRRFDHLKANLSMKRQMEALNLTDKSALLDLYERYRWFNLLGLYRYYQQQKASFTSEECQEIESLFAQMLSTIERQRIPWKLKLKLGYYPYRSYRTFRFWENIHYRMRKMLSIRPFFLSR